MGSDKRTKAGSSMREEGSLEGAHDAYCCYDNNHHRNHQHSTLSRLSVCATYDADDDDDDDDDDDCDDDYNDDGGQINHEMGLSMLRLSLDDGDDADEEPSDAEKPAAKHSAVAGELLLDLGSSDSEKEPGCYSLPATPPRRRRRNFPGSGDGSFESKPITGGKVYASENEAHKGNTINWRRHKRVKGESMSGGGGGVMVITRPKGGRKTMRMDLEEVKACQDLGFELEHQKMVEVPGRVSVSGGSTVDTSSGGNSPIAKWRISSPGDDPKEVKARLKVWAHVVALASTSRNPLPES